MFRCIKWLIRLRIIILLLIFVPTINVIAQGSPQEFYIALVSPSGQMIIGTATNGLIRVWDTQTGNILLDINNHSVPQPLSVAWSPDSKKIATAGGDNIVRIWCADNSVNSQCSPGQLINQLLGHADPVTSVAWSFDNRLASGSQLENSSLRIWDMDTFQPIQNIDAGYVSQISWHPTISNLLAYASEYGSVASVNLNSSSLTLNFFIPNPYLSTKSLAWNSNGSQIAIGTLNGNIHIIDTGTKNQIALLQGHTGIVNSLVWNPDNKRLASSGQDGTIRIWNLSNNSSQVITANKNYAATLQISWSSDGTTLYYPNNGDTLIGLPSKTDLVTNCASSQRELGDAHLKGERIRM